MGGCIYYQLTVEALECKYFSYSERFNKNKNNVFQHFVTIDDTVVKTMNKSTLFRYEEGKICYLNR